MEPTKVVKANDSHKIDSQLHYIITTNFGFRLHRIHGGTLAKNCEEIPGGLSLCQPYQDSQLFFAVGTGSNAELTRDKLFLWDDIKKMKVAERVFLKPIVDLKVVGDWVAVAQEDKVVIFNFAKDLCKDYVPGGIETKINRRGAMDLFEVKDKLGVKIVVPYPNKNGFAQIIDISNEGDIKIKFCDVTFDDKNFQMIRFTAEGSLLVVATHDGKMIKIVGEDNGKLVNEVTRGASDAVISCISLS
jgi:hypothetical protein